MAKDGVMALGDQINVSKVMRGCALAWLSTVSVACVAADSYVEGGATFDQLDNNYADWRGYYVNGSHKFAPRQSVYGGVMRTERYHLQDNQLTLGTYQPVAQGTGALFEATYSDTHEVLAKWSTLAQLEQNLGGGWNVSAGWLHRVYNSSTNNAARVIVDRYWSNYRAGYSATFGRTQGLENTLGHHLFADYYYSDLDRVGVGFAVGEELDNTNTALVRSSVQSAYVRGLHMLTDDIGMTYQLTRHRQGDYYTRTGVSVGLRYLF